jgi:geranylgeranyl diphosphate synthase, type I
LAHPAILDRYRREVDKELRAVLDRQGPPVLYRMARYHLGWEDLEGRPTEYSGGKALRSTFCLLACEAVGGDWRRALPAAAALELVHNFSLVHDDIQDRDRERRHQPTVWAVWGEGQAINAGDALLSLAHIAVLKLAQEGLPAATVVEAARILDERTVEMVEGQVMDLSFEPLLDVDLAEYLEMIEKKTGALFDCSLRLGALVGGDDSEQAETLGRCGRLLGLAFQIRDDMLGIWGVEDQTGKPLAADIRRRKKSLPVVYALSRAEGDVLQDMRRIYSREEVGDEDVSLMLRYLDDLKAQAYCQRMAKEVEASALAELDRLNLSSQAAEELRGAAAFLLEREY